MSKNVSIYLAGGMGGVSFEEQIRWRNQIRDAILYGLYEYTYKPLFFSPPMYYNFEEQNHNTEREVMEYDLNRLRNSDLVIVNFNNPNSIGTAMELAIAYENRIPVVGINEDKCELHPWLVESVTRMCYSLRETIKYVVDFHLN